MSSLQISKHCGGENRISAPDHGFQEAASRELNTISQLVYGACGYVGLPKYVGNAADDVNPCFGSALCMLMLSQSGRPNEVH